MFTNEINHLSPFYFIKFLEAYFWDLKIILRTKLCLYFYEKE